jgi:hypothetical protein
VVVPDEARGAEARAINSGASVKIGELEALTDLKPQFGLVTALGLEDTPGLFERIVPAAFAKLKPGGTLVLRLRLTEAATLKDETASYQTVSLGGGQSEKHAYVIRNTREVLDALRLLAASRIYAYGYSGNPSSTARTPLRMVCFCVFAITKKEAGTSGEPVIDLQLPKQFLKAV